MSNLKFTTDHEWISVEGDIATVGITNFAQEQLGDIVYIELPAEGDEVTKGDEVVVIESVKAAGEIHSPLAGTVVGVNETLAETPEIVNQDPQGSGWFFKLRVSGAIDLGGLLDEAEYNAQLEAEN